METIHIICKLSSYIIQLGKEKRKRKNEGKNLLNNFLSMGKGKEKKLVRKKKTSTERKKN